MNIILFDDAYMQGLVDKFRSAFRKGQLHTALRYWIALYTALPEAPTSEAYIQYQRYIGQIPDNEVYVITDYYKRVSSYYK